MFGRSNELAVLEAAYQRNTFQFLVMYGRRRVGKTTILQAAARHPRATVRPAQEKPAALTRHAFSESVQRFCTGDFLATFPDWAKALTYLGRQAMPEQRLVLIIDE